MSLLLQALKQIEQKTPTKVAVEPPAERQAEVSPPQTERRPDADADVPASSGTISLIRQYEASETKTEIALAGPVHLVPFVPMPARAESRSAKRGERRRRRFADEVLKLLPHDGPAVIGLAPAEGVEVWPVLRELCRGLVAEADGDVLAVAQTTNSVSQGSLGGPRFSDLVSARDQWQSAVCRDEADGFFITRRGDDGAIAASSGRSLLKLWQELNEHFAYVVVDTGLSDPAAATSLVASCDGTFAVVRLDRTNRREVERLITRIRTIGGRACGCLVVD